MRVIHKFPLQAFQEQPVRMPAGAKVLAAHAQRNVPTLWAEVEAGAPLADYRVMLVGTGDEVPRGGGYRYVGTVLLSGDALVFHVYVEGA